MVQIPRAGSFGSVTLIDWWETPDGRKVASMAGRLTLLKGDDFDFIPGAADRATVRGVHFHAPGRTLGADHYRVP